jgi:hypothetical protein
MTLVVGAVITLATDAGLRERAKSCLRAQPGLELGSEHGQRLVAVAITAGKCEDRDLWRTVASVDGVVGVDQVFAAWEDLQ